MQGILTKGEFDCSDEEDNMDDDDEKIAVAATFGISAVFGKASPRCSPSKMRHTVASKAPSPLVTSFNSPRSV